MRRDVGGLSAAARTGSQHALVVEDPRFRRHTGTPRHRYLSEALTDLDRRLDGNLLRSTGATAVELLTAAARLGVRTVHAEKEFSPMGRRIEAEVRAALSSAGIGLELHSGRFLVDPGTLRDARGQRIRSFSRFYAAWCSALPAAYQDPLTEHLSPGEPQQSYLPAATRDASYRRWRNWSSLHLTSYGDDRDIPALDGTTRLSAALRIGLVPAGVLAFAGNEPLRREVAFREFFADLLWHHPTASTQSIDSRFDVPVSSSDTARFQRFVTGRTGFPLVDAGVRQLLSSGWMHNRVRMVVASFLVKDLHLPWQWGAEFFQQHLLDGDVASNSANWQWVAGSSPDAAPFFRVFNPVLQSEKFDPSGSYIRSWVPELEAVPADQIHDPTRRCIRLPDNYPEAMVDHATERGVALAWFRSLKN